MRYMKMLTGSKVSDEAFMTRNRICALLADLGSGLSDCSSRMARRPIGVAALRSEEHTSELQSLMRTSYAVFCWKKKRTTHTSTHDTPDMRTNDKQTTT